MKDSGRNKYIKASDIVFAVLILAACFVLFFLLNAGGPGDTVQISRGGEVLAELPLDKDAVYTVEGDYTNTVVIRDGTVYVSESTCPNHICEKTGRISQPGQSIICAPNGAVITVKGDSAVDAVSQ